MDSTALHTLLNQSEHARVNRHNLAVVHGTNAIERLLKLTEGRRAARPGGQSRPATAWIDDRGAGRLR